MVLRIAHVDDDSDIRESVQLILKKNGYEVDSYLTMQDFLDSLKTNTNRPNLAILDVMVESMDSGLTTFANLHKNYPEMQAIFLTSLGDMIRPYFENQSHEWVCIMEKPVEPISLLATINARLKNKDGQIA